MTWISKFRIRRRIRHEQNITLELTTMCNLKCIFCPHDSLNLPPEHIDGKLLHDIITKMRGTEWTYISLVGLGEPLLYPQLTNIILLLHDNFPVSSLRLTTNGTMDASKLIPYLNERDNLTFSMNSQGNPVKQMQNLMTFLQRYHTLNGKFSVTIQVFDQELPEISSYLSKKVTINRKHFYNWSAFHDRVTLKRYPCLMLWNSIQIDVHGNTYACCQGVGTREDSTLKLGHVNDYPTIAELYLVSIVKYRNDQLHNKYCEDCLNCNIFHEWKNTFFRFRGRWW